MTVGLPQQGMQDMTLTTSTLLPPHQTPPSLPHQPPTSLPPQPPTSHPPQPPTSHHPTSLPSPTSHLTPFSASHLHGGTRGGPAERSKSSFDRIVGEIDSILPQLLQVGTPNTPVCPLDQFACIFEYTMIIKNGLRFGTIFQTLAYKL